MVRLFGYLSANTNYFPWHVQAQKAELKTQALNKIEQGRRLLGLDMVVRTPSGEAATENNTPLIQLYQLHRTTLVQHNNRVAGARGTSSGGDGGSQVTPQASAAAAAALSKAAAAGGPGGTVRGRPSLSASSASLTIPSEAPRPPSRHLILNMKGFICNVNDETELYFYLVHHPTNRPSVILTDQFQVILTARGMVVDTTRAGDMKTVFKDLPSMLPLNEIYLCCKIIRKGAMAAKESLMVTQQKKDKEKKQEANDLRRPFGTCPSFPM